MGPPRISSVQNRLEKVGDLRGIAILVQSNLTFLIFTRSKCLGLSSSIFDFGYLYICFLKIKKLFLDAYVVGPVIPKSSAFMVTELHSILRKINHKSTTNIELELLSNYFLIAWVCSDALTVTYILLFDNGVFI